MRLERVSLGFSSFLDVFTAMATQAKYLESYFILSVDDALIALECVLRCPNLADVAFRKLKCFKTLRQALFNVQSIKFHFGCFSHQFFTDSCQGWVKILKKLSLFESNNNKINRRSLLRIVFHIVHI